MDNFKDIELGGRKWRVKKFDARTGSYMLFKVIGLLAPAFKKIDLKGVKEIKDVKDVDINFTEVIAGMTTLSEQDFTYIQDKCLGVCYELLQAGETKVLNENNTFGVTGIENDTMLALGLTAHALIFNVTGFFGGNPLGSITGGLLTSILQDAKT